MGIFARNSLARECRERTISDWFVALGGAVLPAKPANRSLTYRPLDVTNGRPPAFRA